MSMATVASSQGNDFTSKIRHALSVLPQSSSADHISGESGGSGGSFGGGVNTSAIPLVATVSSVGSSPLGAPEFALRAALRRGPAQVWIGDGGS